MSGYVISEKYFAVAKCQKTPNFDQSEGTTSKIDAAIVTHSQRTSERKAVSMEINVLI